MAQDQIPPLTALRGSPWTYWLSLIEEYQNSLAGQTGEIHTLSNVSLLPRRDISLFGSYPKMDVRVICQCEKCSKVLMPNAFVSHNREKHGPGQILNMPVIPPGTSLLKKNKYAHSKNKKKTILPPPVPPPPLFPKQITPPNSPIAASSTATATTTDLPPPILQPVQATKSIITSPSPTSPTHTTANSTNNSSSNNSSKHKISKKSYKKVRYYDPDKHCGVVEGHRGPCLRSITCSNHMVHLRKGVPGRSKDFHQLIADHKAAKEKEVIIKPCPAPSMPNLDTTSPSTSPIPPFRSISTSFRKFANASQVYTAKPSLMTKPTDNIKILSQPLHVKIESPVINNCSSQGNKDTPVVYMPMSPVAVVSPIQFVQLGGPMLRVASTQPILSPPLATQPIVVTIPGIQGNTAKMYTTHPKPLLMSTCSTRKVGGTFVLQNQRIDRQRSEIQIAANTRRSITNSCSLLNNHHKPNILKNSIRNSGVNFKINTVKRQAVDKLVNDNSSKHIRLNDVNGFIIHTDVNEASEAPSQTNNSIHEKVTFINTK